MALTLTSNIDATQRFIGVSGTIDVEPGYQFRLGDELLELQGFVMPYATVQIDPNRWYVRRGQAGSVAASHVAGTALKGVVDAYASGGTDVPPSPFAGGGGGGQTADVQAALDGANAPDADNVFATMADVGGGGAGLVSADFLFTEQASAVNFSLLIVALDQGGKTFSVSGDQQRFFRSDLIQLVISGSTGNDGVYTTAGASFDDVVTTVSVNEAIPDDTADGSIVFGYYTAELPIEAGTLIEDVRIYNLSDNAVGTWMADFAVFDAYDDTDFADLSQNSFYTSVPVGHDFSEFGLDNTYPDILNFTSSRSLRGYTVRDTDGDNPWFGYKGLAMAPYATNAVRDAAGTGTTPALIPATTGVGYLYAAPTTLRLSVISTIASPPVVPSGVLRVSVWYRAPVTPTASTAP